MRAYLINRQIDDIRGTVYRQTMFAEFEKIAHAMEEAGEPLTLESLTQAYRGLLEAYFGPDFTLDPELDLECLRIPHFYSAFYVYKYATGISAAVALAEQVLGGASAERYLGFLKSGGSKFPIPTLQAAGVDMSTAGADRERAAAVCEAGGGAGGVDGVRRRSASASPRRGVVPAPTPYPRLKAAAPTPACSRSASSGQCGSIRR